MNYLKKLFGKWHECSLCGKDAVNQAELAFWNLKCQYTDLLNRYDKSQSELNLSHERFEDLRAELQNWKDFRNGSP